jgi:hypothetical protein
MTMVLAGGVIATRQYLRPEVEKNLINTENILYCGDLIPGLITIKFRENAELKEKFLFLNNFLKNDERITLINYFDQNLKLKNRDWIFDPENRFFYYRLERLASKTNELLEKIKKDSRIINIDLISPVFFEVKFKDEIAKTDFIKENPNISIFPKNIYFTHQINEQNELLVTSPTSNLLNTLSLIKANWEENHPEIKIDMLYSPNLSFQIKYSRDIPDAEIADAFEKISLIIPTIEKVTHLITPLGEETNWIDKVLNNKSIIESVKQTTYPCFPQF